MANRTFLEVVIPGAGFDPGRRHAIEEELDAALNEGDIGEVTGGGSASSSCNIDIEVELSPTILREIRDILRSHGVPSGTIVNVSDGSSRSQLSVYCEPIPALSSDALRGRQTTPAREASSCDDDPRAAALELLRALELVFDRDWFYTKTELGIPDAEPVAASLRAMFSEAAQTPHTRPSTFLKPSANDIPANWGNYERLLEAYARLRNAVELTTSEPATSTASSTPPAHALRRDTLPQVFLLEHVHELDGHDDVKLIGAYSSRQAAEVARTRMLAQPGFSSFPDGFNISAYVLDQDHWLEGFVTLVSIEIPQIETGDSVTAHASIDADGFYKIAPRQGEITDAWCFQPGQIVRCEERASPEGSMRLVAIALATDSMQK